MVELVKLIDIRDIIVGKTVSFPVGVDKGKKIVVQRIVPWRKGTEQVFYQKGKVSIILDLETEVTIYE